MDDHQRALSVLATEECVSLLGASHVGRVAFAARDQLHVIPVNYAADDEGRVVFRTAPGTLLNEASLQQVAFQVDSVDTAARTGWSVCVHGVGREVTSADDLGAVHARHLAVKPWAPGERDVWFVVIPLAITGRRLTFNSDDPFDYWFSGIPTS